MYQRANNKHSSSRIHRSKMVDMDRIKILAYCVSQIGRDLV